MANAPSSFSFALAVGAAGAYVDVSTDVVWDSSITRTWGTQNQFQQISPGVFAFTLDNRTGKYTPDNAASSLATLLGEGTGCCWSLNGVLRSGKVRAVQPTFLDMGVPSTARVRITVADMLNDAALNTLTTDLPDAISTAASQYLMWTLGDAVGSQAAAQSTANGVLGPLAPLQLIPFSGGSAFGIPQIAGLPGTTAFNIGSAGPSNGDQFTAFPVVGTQIPYPQSSMGFWNLWGIPTVNGTVSVGAVPVGGTGSLPAGQNVAIFGWDSTKYFLTAGSSAVSSWTPPASHLGNPHLMTLGIATTFSTTWTITCTLYVDGVSECVAVWAGTAPTSLTTAQRQPAQVGLSYNSTVITTSNMTVARLSHTLTQAHEEYALGLTEASRLLAYDASQSQLTFSTLPTDLSTAPIGLASNQSGQSMLDAIIGVVDTEQGYVDTTTSGTLLAPVQSIRFRSRQRPVTASATYAVGTDLTGSPTFLRALTDEISSDIVNGSNSGTQTVTNTALITRVGSANSTDTVLTYQASDLYEWGSDRINRGIKRTVDITSITLDACGGSGSNLWTIITALNPGDRIHLTGLPVTQLGYSTWDGFLIGADENHMNKVQSVFTLYLAPCPPATGIFDTDLFDAGGNCALTTAMTTGTGSAIVNSADGVSWFEQTATGYYIQIDSEVMKVTAAAAPSGGLQTLTVTRAQNSTVAAIHAIGATPEVVDNSSDVTNNAIFQF